jgi:hypothetical protein
MIRRCTEVQSKNYKNYGERGIYVCRLWMLNFMAFEKWAKKNGYTRNLILDRKDNNGPYEPANCRWVTAKVSANNRRSSLNLTIFGETKTAKAWAEDKRCSVDYATFLARLKYGWGVSRALTQPSMRKMAA